MKISPPSWLFSIMAIPSKLVENILGGYSGLFDSYNFAYAMVLESEKEEPIKSSDIKLGSRELYANLIKSSYTINKFELAPCDDSSNSNNFSMNLRCEL